MPRLMLVLHSHLPWVKNAGRWPFGEEWLYEATAETYIPLLDELNLLLREDIPYKITVGITPVLTEMLIDGELQKRFLEYLDHRIEAAQHDRQLFETRGEARFVPLSKFWETWYKHIRHSYLGYAGDIPGAFRELEEEGRVELITSSATHGFLPLLGTDESVRLQIRTAIKNHERVFGHPPHGIWLPECAYRPAMEDRPGLEQFLQHYGLKYFFVDTHALTGGETTRIPFGVYSPLHDEEAQVVTGDRRERRAPGTGAGYYVGDSGVAVFGRNRAAGLQVWAAETGYPGASEYREFHKKASTSGLQYWKITGRGVDLGEKELYDPGAAFSRTREQAEHFLETVKSATEESGDLVVAPYDAELFGHWWFEGPRWLSHLIRLAAADPDITMISGSDYLARTPPREKVTLGRTSWGRNGDYSSWYNSGVDWMWPKIYAAERRWVRLKGAEESPAKDQLARELLLLQSSDWPFLITTGQAKDYAVKRFQEHLERFNQLAAQIESGVYQSKDWWEADSLFPPGVLE